MDAASPAKPRPRPQYHRRLQGIVIPCCGLHGSHRPSSYPFLAPRYSFAAYPYQHSLVVSFRHVDSGLSWVLCDPLLCPASHPEFIREDGVGFFFSSRRGSTRLLCRPPVLIPSPASGSRHASSHLGACRHRCHELSLHEPPDLWGGFSRDRTGEGSLGSCLRVRACQVKSTCFPIPRFISATWGCLEVSHCSPRSLALKWEQVGRVIVPNPRGHRSAQTTCL